MRFLFLVVLACLVWYFWGNKETYLGNALSQRIGHPISIDQCSIASDSIHLKGVTLYHTPGNPAVRISHVYISGSWKNLLSNPLPLKNITLSGLSIYINYEDHLHHNWQALLAKTFPATRTIVIHECMLEGCQVFIKRPQRSLIDRGYIGIFSLTLNQGMSIGQITHHILTALLDHAGIYTPYKERLEPPHSLTAPKQMEDIRPHLRF